ncbi:ATP-dependent helicase Lhr and Lhr-like helicase [Lentzea fradiae]|uniref:ATP-dependent helicase Lhr and Lhr-like helicase n=1 Tax=Lentzea fradiae TaxID=200378 RepID=A0A1G7SBL1_9PSEU|nr:DEAD/DEAH box helicase [Lentzea fradiae]SDG20408.1 ATP-dependent helicase Lhr and Lhr-like helicase [Lentzea fradiae]
MSWPPSGSDTSPASSQFFRLHRKVQRWVYRQGWPKLNDAQEQAIPLVLKGTEDVIVSAATASGKTEAAFLPICSALLDEVSEGGVQVLYVSPLKALINDQHRRLDELCESLDLPVHRWHGDVPGSAKAKVLTKPEGVLLITPESLEAMFVLRGTEIGWLLRALRWVVVDEMHSFMGTERGAQLQSLLHRVELVVRRRVPRIGLSATLGDMGSARDYLRPGDGGNVHLLTASHQSSDISVILRGYVNEAATAGDDDESDVGISVERISEHVFTALRGGNNLMFFDRRGDVELYADRLRRRSEERAVPNEFFPHHGSLAKDVREHVEDLLKSSRPVTVLCTSTLEMGIDIGTLTSVAQVGAPPSVASLRQRIGRSGRRGEPAVLRMYVTAQEITADITPQDELRAELFQAVAMMSLLAERWYEPADTSSLHLSTLVQQVMSVIAQHQGAHPVELFRALCLSGPFSHVDKATFAALLRDLGHAGIVQQEPDGLLLLGKVGEQIVDRYSFYAVFAEKQEYRLVHGSRTLGTLHVTTPTEVGSLVIFAGRRWKVVSVDDRASLIQVEPSHGGRAPRFAGGRAEIHDEVRRRMRTWYESDDVPAYLDATAQRLLDEGRAAYRRFDLTRNGALARGDDTIVFPWRGDRVLNTLTAWLTRAGVQAARDGVAFTVPKCTPAQLRAIFQQLLLEDDTTAEDIAAALPDTVVEKHDVHLGEHLRTRAYAAGYLDMAGARSALVDLVGRLPEYDVDVITGTPHVPPPLITTPAVYAVVDIETTGFAARGHDRIIEVAVVRVAPDGTVLSEWSSLVDPQRPLAAMEVHGITEHEVAGAPVFADVAPTLAIHLEGAVVVAHNASFDLNFLDAEFARAGHPFTPRGSLCTMKLDSSIHQAGRRRLPDCLAAVGVPGGHGAAHRALADAKATADLLRHYLAHAPHEVRKVVIGPEHGVSW